MQETECRKCAGCDWQTGGDLQGVAPLIWGRPWLPMVPMVIDEPLFRAICL